MESVDLPPYSLRRRRLLQGALAVGAGALCPLRLTAAGHRPWTVAVIGHTGRGNYGHGLDTCWLGLPETRLVAVADPDAKGRAGAAQRLSLPAEAAYADYREMLKRHQPDLVAVSPRHIDQHRDMILAALEAGAKGLYVEKPFCRDLVEADAIVAACQARGAKLALAHRNRYHPALPQVAALVEEGAIGQLLEIRTRGKEDHRGGALDLWVLGSHLFNLAHHFAGQPLACSAVLLQDGRPVVGKDVVNGAEGTGPLAGHEIHARFDTERGIPVFFDSIANAGKAEAGFGLQLLGTEGLIDLRIDAEPLAHLLPGSPHQPVSEARRWIPISSAGLGKPEPIPEIGPLVAGHRGPVRDLIAAIEEDREPLCSAQDGRTVLEMTMAVFESHLRGGARVEIPLSLRDHPLKRLP